MNIVVKPLEQSKVEITVSLPWENWKKHLDKAAVSVAKDVKMQGFRPGKVPRNVIEQKYGKGVIIAEAAEMAIQQSYPEVLREKNLEPIGKPKADIKVAEEEKDLEYSVITSVMPEVKLEGWEKAVKKINKDQAAEKVEVSEEDVEKEIERLATSRAKFVTVDREARKDDSVEVDFEVFVDGVLIENGTGKKHPLVLGSSAFIPGFEEQVEGMRVDEEKEFVLEFPKEYHATHLAGKAATFKVKLGLVQEREIPEINDEFAQSLGKFKTLNELKDNFRSGMIEEKKAQAEESHRAKIVESLIEVVEVELPEVLVNEEVHKMIHEFEGQIQSMGMNFEDYLKELKKTHEDLHKDWKPQAEKRLKAAMALEEVAKQQEIEIASEQIEAEMNRTLQQYKNVKDIEKNIDLERLHQYAKGKLQNEAVFDVLVKM